MNEQKEINWGKIESVVKSKMRTSSDPFQKQILSEINSIVCPMIISAIKEYHEQTLVEDEK